MIDNPWIMLIYNNMGYLGDILLCPINSWNIYIFLNYFFYIFFIFFIFFVLKQFQRWKSGHNLLSRLQSRQHPMLIPWIHPEFESGKPVPQMVSYQVCFMLEWILGRNGLKYKIQKHLWLLNPLNKTKFKIFDIKNLKGNWKIFPWL